MEVEQEEEASTARPDSGKSAASAWDEEFEAFEGRLKDVFYFKKAPCNDGVF